MHVATLLLAVLPLAAGEAPGKLADRYADAIEKANAAHARRPGEETEDELAARLPARARQALERLLTAKESEATVAALQRAGEAALDLALVDDFTAIRARLAALSPGAEDALGVALVRPRALLRGLGGLDAAYLERFADVLDLVLDAYDEEFAFAEPSKVPGKRLRVRVHLEEAITRPPHFAPELPYCSLIDFPVVDAERFRSPTADGKFLLYGLCHELGHVIAMWGSPGNEEDHHAWAHYAGLVVLDRLAAEEPPALAAARDARWRSLARLREEVADVEPGTGSREAVLALLLRLHDAFGPRRIGDAIDLLDARDRRLRVNRVRYYTFRELGDALQEVLTTREERRQAKAILEG